MRTPKPEGVNVPLSSAQDVSQDPASDLSQKLPHKKSRKKSQKNSHNESQRLFFALWPDDALRQQFASRRKPLVEMVRGRPVPVDNLHITLAFLGDVDVGQRDCVERAATSITCPPFELTLDRVGHWARSRVLWLGASETPEPLVWLVDRLSAGARQCGLVLDARPYRAHLTLMRKVSHAPEKMAVGPLSWPVDRFVLVRSVPVPQGVRYEVLREWPLNGDDPVSIE